MIKKDFIDYLYIHDIPVVEAIGVICCIELNIDVHKDNLKKVRAMLLAHNILTYINDKLILVKDVFIKKQKITDCEIISLKENSLPLIKIEKEDFENMVKEYLYLFKERKPEFPPRKREVYKRLALLMKNNPDITYDDILGATKLYLEREEYIRQTHYFISKGNGLSKIEDILSWIDIYREEKKDDSEEGRTSNTNTMI